MEKSGIKNVSSEFSVQEINRVASNDRLHGIDALRGVAMLLGIVLHAAIAYKIKPQPNWPHDHQYNSIAFDLLYDSIHSFRMPLFFLIAGYFSRLLFFRFGSNGFIKHRFKRILVPFVVSIFIVLPFSIYPFLFYDLMSQYPGEWKLISEKAFKGVLRWNGLAHLWFLYYLLIFYGVVVCYFAFRSNVKLNRMREQISNSFGRLNPGSVSGITLLTIMVWAILLNSKELYLDVDTGIFPDFEYLMFYGAFFVSGWLIHRNCPDFRWIGKHFGFFLCIGIVLFLGLFLWEHYYSESTSQLIWLKMLAAFQIIMLSYGFAGLFLKYFGSGNSVWRYVSDASYLVYLLHLGMIAGLQIFFLDSDLQGPFRFLIVVIFPLLVTFFIYEYLVRYTIVGEYLHGKRNKTPGKNNF